ncbi:MAG: CRISPR-associated ring nuclease [Candidatus Bathyarchaeia archaeon]
MLVLIASLGRSPGVVTSTIDALNDTGRKSSRVYLATTSDPIIWEKCIPLLREDFRERYPDVELRDAEIYIKSSDIYDEDDNAEFARKVGCVIAREVRAGNDVYISLAGGRKTMSAVMALLGQLYGVRSILHILTDPELERDGEVTKLLELPMDRRKLVLHPPAEKRRLVEFPVFAIPWHIDQVIEALELGESNIHALDKLIKRMSAKTRKWLLAVLREAEELSKIQGKR